MSNLLDEIINNIGTENPAYKLIFEIDAELCKMRHKLSDQELVEQIDKIRLKLNPTFRMVEC